MQINKAQDDRQWDNRILDFDGEDHVCIGCVVDSTLKAHAEISYILEKVSISATMICDEIWVPFAQLFMALEALDGVPVFYKNNSEENWSVNAPEMDRGWSIED